MRGVNGEGWTDEWGGDERGIGLDRQRMEEDEDEGEEWGREGGEVNVGLGWIGEGMH